jgi:kynurenine formamidase
MADATEGLWGVFTHELAGARYTDLTHAFFPGQPHFAAFPDERRSFVFDHSASSFQVDRYELVGQWGTHVDPPLHFVADGRPLDALDVAEMLRPLVVLDISARVALDPDACPTLEDLAAWEARHGRVPAGAFVALRTDWHHRWPDPARMANKDADDVAHSPGWSRPVLEVLFEQRGIVAIGHETLDTDPGSATSKGDYGLETYVLRRDRWQIELLANLDAVPEAGALVMATWPKPRGGSGFPARVVAIHRA